MEYISYKNYKAVIYLFVKIIVIQVHDEMLRIK